MTGSSEKSAASARRRGYASTGESRLGWSLTVCDADTPWGSPPVDVTYQAKRPTRAEKARAVRRVLGVDAEVLWW